MDMAAEMLDKTCPGTREAGVMAPGYPIALDYTLCDLYSLDSNGAPLPTHVFNSRPGVDHGASAETTKFTYSSRFAVGDTAADPSSRLSSKALPQRYAFSAGRMPVAVVGLDAPADHAHLRRTLSQLRHDQQPVMSVVADPARLQLGADSRAAVARPEDCLAHLAHAVDAETHYVLLSKRGLARSGLRTPASTVVDAALAPEHAGDGARVEAEVARMTRPLDARRVPFMVKLNQSLGGKGTLAVRCEAERARARALVAAQLREALPRINAANQALHPCSLVLQDLVAGGAVGLSLFVTPRGRAVFVGCSEQHFDESGHWAGGSVSYPDQEALRRKHARPMEETARFLHQSGYHGPAGIDIMTDGAGAQYVIDLNARITGSYHLGLLAGHFTRRGLARATVVKAYFPCSRAVFEETFAREISDGRLIVTGWARDEALALSQGGITVGGRDAADTESLVAAVQAIAVPLGALVAKPRDSGLPATCSGGRHAGVDLVGSMAVTASPRAV